MRRSRFRRVYDIEYSWARFSRKTGTGKWKTVGTSLPIAVSTCESAKRQLDEAVIQLDGIHASPAKVRNTVNCTVNLHQLCTLRCAFALKKTASFATISPDEEALTEPAGRAFKKRLRKRTKYDNLRNYRAISHPRDAVHPLAAPTNGS